MPIVIHIKCQSCGHGPEVKARFPGLKPWHTEFDTTTLPSNYKALEIHDGTLIRLHHPGETHELKDHGYTWETAARSGRLLSVHLKVCADCGTINEEGEVSNEGWGCGPGLIIAIAVLLLMKFLVHVNWLISIPVSIVVGFLATMAVSEVSPKYTRLRWRRKNADLKVTSCLACNGKTFIPIYKAEGKPQMCPHCHTRNMQYTCGGIS
jgi:hypothetical protein